MKTPYHFFTLQQLNKCIDNYSHINQQIIDNFLIYEMCDFEFHDYMCDKKYQFNNDDDLKQFITTHALYLLHHIKIDIDLTYDDKFNSMYIYFDFNSIDLNTLHEFTECTSQIASHLNTYKNDIIKTCIKMYECIK